MAINYFEIIDKKSKVHLFLRKSNIYFLNLFILQINKLNV
jgi:hypothetical protein